MAMRSKRQTVPTTRRSQIGQQRRSIGGGWDEKFDMSDVKVAFEGGEGERDFVPTMLSRTVGGNIISVGSITRRG